MRSVREMGTEARRELHRQTKTDAVVKDISERSFATHEPKRHLPSGKMCICAIREFRQCYYFCTGNHGGAFCWRLSPQLLADLPAPGWSKPSVTARLTARGLRHGRPLSLPSAACCFWQKPVPSG